MGDLFDFDSLLKRLRQQPQADLPGDLAPIGAAGTRYLPLLVDANDALVIDLLPREYRAALPMQIGTGYTEICAADDQEVTEINIVNVTGSAVTLALYLNEGTPAGSGSEFGMAGGSIAGRAAWQWQGVLQLETRSIWAVAGTGSALYAFVSQREKAGYYR